MHCDFEISHSALDPIEAHLRAAELIFGVLEVGAEQLDLGALPLIEL